MEPYRRLTIILLAVAVTIPVVLSSRRNSTARVSAAFSVLSSPKGYVRISGDVRNPGMYPLSVNLMTVGVISMAMPLQPISVLEPAGVENTPVFIGEALVVHADASGRARVTVGVIPASERLVMCIPLDINSVSAEDLDKVPGIGPALAKKIILCRQNNGGHMSVQDLLQVEGIGEKKFDRIRKYFNCL